MALLVFHAGMTPAVAQVSSASFTRSSGDWITSASLPGIGTVTPGYDATYGHVTALDGGTYSLSTTHDAYSGKPLTQTLVQTGDTGLKTTLSNASSSYDALGRRIKRTVDGGQLSPATVGTGYWYGPMPLKPLSVERQDGTGNKKARVIYLGDEVLAIESGQGSIQASYPVADHLGSTRAVLDGDGNTQYSLGYDDWGQTTISSQASAVDVADLATLFRFQGIEQDIFPLTMLDVDVAEVLVWLDGIGLYHYYGRDYAAGLASFLAMDPAGASVSPYSAFAGSPANYVDPDGMAPIKSLPPFQDFLAHLADCGIEKVLISEAHHQNNNLDMVAKVLSGVGQGKPFRYWCEIMSAYAQEREVPQEKRRATTYDSMMRVFNLRDELRKKLGPSDHAAIRAGVEDTVEELGFRLSMHWEPRRLKQGYTPQQLSEGLQNEKAYRQFRTAMMTPGVKVERIFFDDPASKDMASFIKYKGLSFAVMGAAHAEYRYTGNLDNAPRWSGINQKIPSKAYGHLDETRLKNNYDGFARTVKRHPEATMLLRSSETWEHMDTQAYANRLAALDYYRRQGYAVLEYPVVSLNGEGYNVTVVAPGALASRMLTFIGNENCHAVNFDCSGLPGCASAKAAVPKEEF